MQYRPPHVNNIDGGRQTVCLLPMVTMGVDNSWGYTWPTLLAIQLVRCRVVFNKRIMLVTQLCYYADKRTVNIHDEFAHRTHSSKFRTQPTSAPFLIVGL